MSCLTDDEIQNIFVRVAQSNENEFLQHYALALCRATRKDFLILRPISLILIAKYNLGGSLRGIERSA